MPAGDDGNPALPPLLLFLLLFLPALFLPAASADFSSSPPDALALLAFKFGADPSDRLRFTPTNRSYYEHCWWPGVRCSSQGKVTRLVLEGSGLHGSFQENTLGRLDQLRVLSLKNNSLTGPIPDISGLYNLKAIFLDINRFSGGFPLSVLSLHRIQTLDLSHNNLTGPIPYNLTGLNRLYGLRLELNRFVGSIPPLNQSSLRFFNVSGNDLSGPVPVTAALSAFGTLAFSGNPGLCGKVVGKECRDHFFFSHGMPPSPSPAAAMAGTGGRLTGLLIPDGSSSPRSQRKHRRAVVVIGSLSGGLLVIGLVGILLIRKNNHLMRRKGILFPQKISSSSAAPPNSTEMYVESNNNSSIGLNDNNDSNSNGNLLAAAAAMSDEKVKNLGKSGCLVFCAGEAQVYSLEQLMRASAELLGRGNAGTTYKAVLDNRLIVTVKRLDAAKMKLAGNGAFEQHMEMVGGLRHPNLVPLRAYFEGKEERLLVYDYQPNGSLFSLIHGSRSTRAKPLHWTSCLKIAEDATQGLAYIHQASRLVHGNLKSSNVLLGPDFEACLTDNCLAFLIEPPPDGDGDSGYRAPEILKSNCRLTPKSDIYAFGVLLLELLSGKPPLQHPFLVATDLPIWVRSVREEEDSEDNNQLTLLIEIAAACVRSSPESRPTAWQVLKMIREVKGTDIGDNETDSSSLS